MSGDTTLQALERLTHMPNRSGLQADRIAGQLYYDVEFSGGSISNVTLTDVTINGTSTSRHERIVTAAGGVTVASDDYVITINKTVPQITTVTLPATPATSRSLIIKDGAGNAGDFNITLDGNGKTIDGSSTYVITADFGCIEVIYNGTEWNILNTFKYDGDVVGPVSSTDNAITRFDGTTGLVIQNSTVTISDTGVAAGISIDTTAAANVLKINGTSLTGVTGTGSVVLATSPTLTTPNIGTATGSVSGNAGTATKLQTARNIGNVSFDGTADITPQQLSLASEGSDTSCFVMFANTASSTAQQPKYNSSFGYNASTNTITVDSLNLNAATNQILFDADGTFTGQLTMAALGGNRTWTLPNTSGSLVTTSGAATLSNKVLDNSNTATFKDNGFTLQDDGDATKLLAWQLSGIATGTTRTWTAQDVSGTVYVSGGTDIPVTDGGTGLSSATAYGVICGGTTSTGAFQSVASVGTAGQVLTSNGAGALPTFQASTGGVPNSGLPPLGLSFIGMGNNGTSGTTGAISANTFYQVPFYIGTAQTATRIGVEVTSSSAGNIRMGIYQYVAGGYAAGANLIADLGTVSCGTTGLKEISISQAFTPGLYGLLIVSDATPTLRATAMDASFMAFFNGVNTFSAGSRDACAAYGSMTYGALPATRGVATGWQATANSPSIWIGI